MNILVTGGSGFIGTHLRESLQALGHKTTNYDIREPVDATYDVFAFGDISNNTHSLRSLFKRSDFSVVFHLAAQTSVPYSVNNPTADARTNIIGTLNLLEVCQEFGVKLIFASTAASYGNPANLPILEETPLDPLSPYGVSKVACEGYIRNSGVPHTILRFGNVYGNGGDGVVRRFLLHAFNGRPVYVYGSGEQTRDFIYVKDLVDALIKCIDKGDGLTLNLSTSTVTSVNGVLDVLRERFPKLQVIRDYEKRPGDVEDSLMSNELARTELGWQPAYGLSAGIADMLLEPRAQWLLERE